jgi:hypothetical protein
MKPCSIPANPGDTYLSTAKAVFETKVCDISRTSYELTGPAGESWRARRRRRSSFGGDMLKKEN